MFKPCGSFRFTHQVKFSSSLWKIRSRKFEIAGAAALVAVVLEDAHCRPGMHRRIDVAECPFIGRQLAVRMHQPDLAQQQQLRLGEIRIDQRKRDAMKGEVPGGEPGIFPLVRHRHDVGGDEVRPIAVAAVLAALGRRGLSGSPLSHCRTLKS